MSTSLIPIDDTESQWENHFLDMARGKLPFTDYYVVSVNQRGEGEKKKDPDNPMEDKIFGETHNPSTGRIINPISAAANQIEEHTRTVTPSYKGAIKPASKKKITSTPKKQSKKTAAALTQETKPKRSYTKKKKPPLSFIGPDALGS